MIRKAAALLIVFLATASLSFAGPALKEGKWEITTKMEMPGMPMEMPAFTHTQCMTNNDFLPENTQQQQSEDCDAVDVKTSGNTVTWSTKCKGEDGDIIGTGTMTYKGDTFTGTMKVNQGGMVMTTKMNGKYIGKCDK
ncbi:MAG: DUF3617 family protein [Desulfobacteraceae bacterium]|nr:MAG: DUF3617 family protein [Desulfobacteraceae bacterium]